MSVVTGVLSAPICTTGWKSCWPSLMLRVPPKRCVFPAIGCTPSAMRLPRYRLHALKGRLKGYWSVTVRANWRIIFRFEGGDVYEVELIDHH